MEEQDGIALAHHLGRALQLTNILRDLDEGCGARTALSAGGGVARGRHRRDRSRRRADELRARQGLRAPRRAGAHAFRASRRDHGAKSAPPRARAAHHGGGLSADPDRLVARGWSSPRRPIRLPRSRLVWIILRHAFI